MLNAIYPFIAKWSVCIEVRFSRWILQQLYECLEELLCTYSAVESLQVCTPSKTRQYPTSHPRKSNKNFLVLYIVTVSRWQASINSRMDEGKWSDMLMHCNFVLMENWIENANSVVFFSQLQKSEHKEEKLLVGSSKKVSRRIDFRLQRNFFWKEIDFWRWWCAALNKEAGKWELVRFIFAQFCSDRVIGVGFARHSFSISFFYRPTIYTYRLSSLLSKVSQCLKIS